jgi:hypothetical protein
MLLASRKQGVTLGGDFLDETEEESIIYGGEYKKAN